jgi:YVTN family beta-propeller protein
MHRSASHCAGFLAALAFAMIQPPAHALDASPLTLEAKIALGDVSGRIDHLAFDPTRARLYIAELGNNSVGIVDLKANRLVRTVPGLKEPQGIRYEPMTDTVYVANAEDGAVRVFSGAEFAPLATIALGEDADNVRIDEKAHRVYVGYGSGALAVIDPTSRKRIADIALKGHPESFQLDPAGNDIFVNVPDAGHIAVVSRDANRQVGSWPTGNLRANFPLVLDKEKDRVISIFRHPARLEAYETRTGRKLNGADVCTDSDDAFIDSKRHRVYVICGEGYVDTFDSSGDAFTRMGHFPTSGGSRTGLFVPELDLLIVAIRASGREGAAVWLLRPSA